MKKKLVSAAVVAGALFATVWGQAGTAAAYPVGPYHLEGPCKGKAPRDCAMSPSPDGLTWAFHGDGWNYDKQGHFVCMSSSIWCGPVMDTLVRPTPPQDYSWLTSFGS